MFNFHTDIFHSLLKGKVNSITIDLPHNISINFSYSKTDSTLKIIVNETIIENVIGISELINETVVLKSNYFNLKNLMYQFKVVIQQLLDILVDFKEEKYNSLIYFLNFLFNEVLVSISNGLSINYNNTFTIITLWDIKTKEIYNYRFMSNNSKEIYKFNIQDKYLVKIKKNKELVQLMNHFDKCNIYLNKKDYSDINVEDYYSPDKYLNIDENPLFLNKIMTDIMYEIS